MGVASISLLSSDWQTTPNTFPTGMLAGIMMLPTPYCKFISYLSLLIGLDIQVSLSSWGHHIIIWPPKLLFFLLQGWNHPSVLSGDQRLPSFFKINCFFIFSCLEGRRWANEPILNPVKIFQCSLASCAPIAKRWWNIPGPMGKMSFTLVWFVHLWCNCCYWVVKNNPFSSKRTQVAKNMANVLIAL